MDVGIRSDQSVVVHLRNGDLKLINVYIKDHVEQILMKNKIIAHHEGSSISDFLSEVISSYNKLNNLKPSISVSVQHDFIFHGSKQLLKRII